MKTKKETSFSDFLREETFSKEIVIEQTPENSPPIDFTPELMETEHTASEAETKIFWNSLRQFFRTGEKPHHQKQETIYPALLAPYLKGQKPETDYPFYIAEESPKNQIPNSKPQTPNSNNEIEKLGLETWDLGPGIFSLREMLENTFNTIFKEKEANILKANLPRFVEYCKQQMVGKKNIYDFYPVADFAFSKLMKLDVHGEEGKIFKEQVSKLMSALPESGKLLPFSPLVPFYLLNNQLNLLSKKKLTFCDKIKKLTSGLHALLSVEWEKIGKDKSGNGMQQSYDFASSMIAFEKIAEMMPASASERMSENRLKRINDVLSTLSNAEKQLAGNKAKIFVRDEFADKISLAELFGENALQIISDNVCEAAMSSFEKEINDFIHLIISVRIAELELKDKFDEDIHSSHFSFFNWNNLTENELSLFPPIFIFEKTETLLKKELESYSELLASNFPIKILAVNNDFGINDFPENELQSFRQELAALTIAHRGTYIFQGGADESVLLNKCLHDGLSSPSPALWHLLLPVFSENDESGNFLKTTSAIESRFFPRIIYNHQLGIQLGSRFDIRCNPQPERRLPEYSIEIKKGKAKDTLKLSFCLADYLIQDISKANQLLLIPIEFWTDDLLSLSDYLEKKEEHLIGKIPFIWVTDEENKLQKAALPFSWLTDCNERLDFWQFIQELGGVNSYHIEQALERGRQEWDEEKEREIVSLKEVHLAEEEKIRNETAGQAMDKLVAVLLDLDNLVSVSPAKSSHVKSGKTETSLPAENKEGKISEEKKEEVLVSSEPWVESFRCTTCNDCTDKLPSVFKYNADKQAYIADASKATFAQLVAVAEKCPAKCIHTGQPQNPNEPGLAELIIRAKPFN